MPLDPSLMKELQFYEQKAKEMAEVLFKWYFLKKTPDFHFRFASTIR